MRLTAQKTYLKPIHGLFRKVESIYNKTRQVRFDTPDHYLYSALSAYEQCDVGSALSTLEAGLNRHPASQAMIERYLQICCEQEQLGRMMEFVNPARQVYSAFGGFLGSAGDQQQLRLGWLTPELLDKYSYEPVTLWRLADLLEHGGQIDAAQKIYFKLSKRPLNSSEAHFYVGLSELRLGSFEICFDILHDGLIAYPEATNIKVILEQLCYGRLDFDRYLKVVATTSPNDHSDKSISASNFYRIAIKKSPLEMFILKYKDMQCNCDPDELNSLTEVFFEHVSECGFTFVKAKQLTFFVKLLDISGPFADKILSILSSLTWGEDDKRKKYLLGLIRALTLPIAPHGTSDLGEVIEKFATEVRDAAQNPTELTEPLLDFSRDWAPWQGLFCLAQPRRYRHAMSAFETLAFKLWPKLDYTASHIRSATALQTGAKKKIRIGFTVLDTMPMMSGFMERLDRTIFETVYLRPGKPGTSKAARGWIAHADATVEYSDTDAYSAIETIANQKLDILISGPSVPQIFFPLMARLAHLQMVLLEPNWSDGITNSDYYISWKIAEPTHCEDFYKASVSLLQHPPYWIENPSLEEKSAITEAAGDEIRRRLLGLNPEDRFYLCPNTPPKIHPEMDEILYKILERDPGSSLVLLRGDQASARPLKARLKEKFGATYERILFVNTLRRVDAHSLLLSADCYLDSYPICGMSSSFDSLMLGVPIVTLPADIPFGKWTAAIYEYIGVSGLTARDADEYIDIAIKLANDKDWRQRKSAEIIKKSSVYVESQASFAEFEHFIVQAWRRKLAGLPPANWVAGEWR